jgi:DNA-binding PadR family transcriptional regulator
MAREKFQTLSEPMYYILLALSEECCGVDIMKKVFEMSHKRVRIGPGTLYTLLAKFEQSKMIKETFVTGRKRSYIITRYGQEVLREEYNRMLTMIAEGKELLGAEG